MPVFLVVKGDKIKLEPDVGWAWEGFDGEIILNGGQSILTVEGKPVIVETDIMQLKVTGKQYKTDIFSDTPGTIQSVIFNIEPSTLSHHILSQKIKSVTKNTKGSYQAIVVTPATKSVLGVSTSDTIMLKTGKWQVESGQEIMAVEATAPQSLSPKTQPESSSANITTSNQEKSDVKEGEKSTNENTIEHIIVLVAGTVDPMNIYDGKKKINDGKRANSYLSKNFYWDQGTFYKQIKEYEKKPHCHVFTDHGWSGDNAVINRKTAGAYLADRLCGSSDPNGEDCYYPKFKERNVSFHFIGHSHGGNVINEITRRMPENPEWPEKWKVKTIVYLSTPFFKELHQVNTAKFHENGKILNVFNKYDLTQRVIANFSLKHFPKLETVLNNNISSLLNDIATFDMTVLKALHKKPSKSDIFLKALLHVLSFKLIPVEINWYMGVQAGKKLYTECGKLFSNIDSLLDETQKIVKFLNTKVELKLPKGLKGKVPSQRQIISDALKDRLLEKLRIIQNGLAQTIPAFEKRMVQDKYPMLGFFDDVSAFITPVIELLRINSENLTGELSNLVYDIVIEQIDRYDNTTNSPDHQLPKKYKIHPVNVTKHDPYCGMRDQQFDRFITQMEKIETRYAQNQTRQNLLDMLFTLIAQLEFIHNNLQNLDELLDELGNSISQWDIIDWCISKENTHFENTANKLIEVLKDYLAIFQNRNFGGIVVESDPNNPKKGDLIYLMRQSHAISHLELYEKIAKVIEEQFGTA